MHEKHMGSYLEIKVSILYFSKKISRFFPFLHELLYLTLFVKTVHSTFQNLF